MLLGAVAADAQQRDDADGHAGRVGPPGRLDVLLDAVALGDLLQGDRVARLGADVQQRQARLAQRLQLVVGLLEHVAGHGVARHPPRPGQPLPHPAQDGQPVVHGHHQRVAVGDKDLVDPPAYPAPCLVQVGQRAGQIPHPEGFFAVHVAVGAVVPRAADGGLQDVRVGLGGGPIELAFVAHEDRPAVWQQRPPVRTVDRPL